MNDGSLYEEGGAAEGAEKDNVAWVANDKRFAGLAAHSWYWVTMNDGGKRLAWWNGSDWFLDARRLPRSRVVEAGERVERRL